MRKRINSKINIVLFMIGPTIAMIIMAVMAVIDPIGVLHSHGLRVGIIKDMRRQAAGLVHVMPDVNSIILGSSVMENISARESEKILGGVFANISIYGSSFYERKFVLDGVLREGNIKNVIYSMDSLYLSQSMEHVVRATREFDYLYNLNPFDDVLVYQDFSIFKCMFQLDDMHRICSSSDVRFERPNSWSVSEANNQRFGGLGKWIDSARSRQIAADLQRVKNASEIITSGDIPVLDVDQGRAQEKLTIEYIDKYVLKYAQKYPETQFHLVFPPYHRMVFAELHQILPQYSFVHESAIRYLAMRAQTLKNLHVYGYEDMAFLDDISNYIDAGHYHVRFDSLILRSIRDGENSITEGNVEEYLDEARKKAFAFDFVGLQKNISDISAAKTK